MAPPDGCDRWSLAEGHRGERERERGNEEGHRGEKFPELMGSKEKVMDDSRNQCLMERAREREFRGSNSSQSLMLQQEKVVDN